MAVSLSLYQMYQLIHTQHQVIRYISRYSTNEILSLFNKKYDFPRTNNSAVRLLFCISIEELTRDESATNQLFELLVPVAHSSSVMN